MFSENVDQDNQMLKNIPYWNMMVFSDEYPQNLNPTSDCYLEPDKKGKHSIYAKVSDTYSPADWMPADKRTEISRIKLKTWTQQPVPMISKHSAHSTSMPVGSRTWLWRYTCLLLLISMLWHRQAIFESKGDKLSSSAECRIRTQGLRHLFASTLNACWQTDWAIEDQAKLLNSTVRPYDQQTFGPLDLYDQ